MVTGDMTEVYFVQSNLGIGSGYRFWVLGMNTQIYHRLLDPHPASIHVYC